MKTLRTLLMLIAAVAMSFSTMSCSWWAANKGEVKSIVQTVDQIAQNLCGIFYGDKLQLNVTDAMKMYCDTREKYAPWIDQVLAGAKSGGELKLQSVSKTLPVPADSLSDPWGIPPAPVQPVTAPSVAPTQTPPPQMNPTPTTVTEPAKGKR